MALIHPETAGFCHNGCLRRRKNYTLARSALYGCRIVYNRKLFDFPSDPVLFDAPDRWLNSYSKCHSHNEIHQFKHNLYFLVDFAVVRAKLTAC
jgi:hypothetical protein